MIREFRKKPTVVEAMQWDGSMDSQRAIVRWGEPAVSGWFDNDYYLEIRTAGDGRAKARAGDWIVRQKVNGRWYYWPVAADIFAATYEPASEPTELERAREIIERLLLATSKSEIGWDSRDDAAVAAGVAFVAPSTVPGEATP